MKIAAATVDLSASHAASTRQTVRETLRAWVGDKRPDFETMDRSAGGAASGQSSIAVISAAALNAIKNAPAPSVSMPAPQQSGEAQAIRDAANSVENDPLLNMLKTIVEMLIGHSIRVTGAGDFEPDQAPVEMPEPAQPKPAQTRAPAGFGIEYDRHEALDETEQASVQVTGKVQTVDGKEVDFKLSLVMSRQYHAESDVSIRKGDGIKKDPLVINFNGSAAQLQSRRFEFDIDDDGKADKLPMLARDSAYLALDRNGNGKIDSGQELFGAGSGDGFGDLAQYYSDSNGWIDESDPAFQNLRVWTPDDKGGGALDSLKQRGVGALFLGNVETPFTLKDGTNNTLGAVRATGVWLTETGTAGSLQQIDLMV